MSVGGTSDTGVELPPAASAAPPAHPRAALPAQPAPGPVVEAVRQRLLDRM